MADGASKSILASSLFFMMFMAGAFSYFVFQRAAPEHMPEPHIAEPQALVEPPPQAAPTTPAAPLPAASPEPSDTKRARTPAGRMARDLKREQIWSALGSSPAQRARAQAEGNADARRAERPERPELPELPTLDTSYIQDAVREQLLPVIQECYQSALEDQPQLAGKLVVQFTIIGAEDIGGVVEDAQIDEASTLDSAFVSECMRESVMGVTFEPPADGGSVTVNYPFEFAPE